MVHLGADFVVQIMRAVTELCPTLCDLMGCSPPGSLTMGFPHWSGLPRPSPGHLPSPGIESAFPALAGGFFTTEPPGLLIIS